MALVVAVGLLRATVGAAEATPGIGVTAETLSQRFTTPAHAFSFTHAVPSTGANRALIVTIGTTAGTAPVADVGTVLWDADTTTLGGEQLMTCDASLNIIIGTSRRIAICTLLNPTVSASSGQVTITLAGLPTVQDTLTTSATTMSGVATFGAGTGSGATKTFATWSSCTGTSSYVCQLAVTTVADQVLFDLVGQGEPDPVGSRSFTEGGAGQHKRDDSPSLLTGPHLRIATSITIATTTSTSLQWTFGGSTSANGVGQLVLPINAASSVSAATPGRFEAFRQPGRGARVSWTTEEEVSHLGFQVWREESGGSRTRVQGLQPGSMFATGDFPLAGRRRYALRDPDGPSGARYWIEEIGTTGGSRWHGPVAATNLESARAKETDVVPPARAFAFTPDSGPALLPAAGAAQRTFPATRPSRVEPAGRACANPPATRPSVKIAVSSAGWYRVGADALVAAGLPTDAAPARLALYADGRPVALEVIGRERVESIAFYGTGLDTRETGTRTYWLVADDARPRRLREADHATEGPLAASYAATVVRRERSVYFAALLNGPADNFFGAAITTAPVTQTLDVSARATDAETATLEIALQGATLDAHDVDVSLAGVTLARLSFAGRAAETRRLDVPAALLRDGANAVVLTPAGAAAGATLVDHVGLTYARRFVAAGDTLTTSLPPGASARLEGFGSPDVRVLDLSDPDAPRALAVAVEPAGDGTFVARVSSPAGDAATTLFAFAPAGASSAEAVTANRPSTLCTERGAELAVVAPRAFFQALEPFVAARVAGGWTVELVDVEDVYDEMSGGAHTAAALARFVRTRLGAHPSARTRHLLLVGDASLDPRNFLGKDVPDFVPTALIDTATMETSSDDALADLDGDGVPELAVGRWPARTEEQVRGFVARTLALGAGTPWSRGALVVAGASDAFAFGPAAARVLAASPPGGDLLDAGALMGAAPAELARLWAKRPSFVTYLGHGSQNVWQGLLSSDALAGADHMGAPAIVAAMTCLNGFFHDVYADCLGERLMRADAGAVWASSSLEDAGAQAELALAFTRHMGGASLGEAARLAKAEHAPMGRAMVLFGDPTLFGRPTSEMTPDGGAPPVIPVVTPLASDGGCAIAGARWPSPFAGLAVVALFLAARARRRR